MPPLLLSLPLLMLSASAWAEETPSETLPPNAITAWQALSAVQTLQATFTQERTSRLLTKPLVAEGELRFARPGKMAWVTSTPGRSTFVMDGTRVGMAWPDLDMREEIDLASSPEMASLVAATMVWLGGDLARVQEDYEVAWTDGTPASVLLTPRSAPLSGIIGTLELTVTVPVIEQVVITEPDGDRVQIRFSDVKIDQPLDAGAFLLP